MYVNSRLNLSRKITFFVCLHVRSLRMQHTTTICVHTGCFMNSAYLPPPTKLGQGNIFRSVCQEFCPQGGV